MASICLDEYKMDQTLSRATISKFKRGSECTSDLRSRHYNATFCYHLPKVHPEEVVGATLVFPALRSTCENVSVENPSNNCQLKMKRRCILEPHVVTEPKTFLECRTS